MGKRKKKNRTRKRSGRKRSYIDDLNGVLLPRERAQALAESAVAIAAMRLGRTVNLIKFALGEIVDHAHRDGVRTDRARWTGLTVLAAYAFEAVKVLDDARTESAILDHAGFAPLRSFLDEPFILKLRKRESGLLYHYRNYTIAHITKDRVATAIKAFEWADPFVLITVDPQRRDSHYSAIDLALFSLPSTVDCPSWEELEIELARHGRVSRVASAVATKSQNIQNIFLATECVIELSRQLVALATPFIAQAFHEIGATLEPLRNENKDGAAREAEGTAHTAVPVSE